MTPEHMTESIRNFAEELKKEIERSLTTMEKLVKELNMETEKKKDYINRIRQKLDALETATGIVITAENTKPEITLTLRCFLDIEFNTSHTLPVHFDDVEAITESVKKLIRHAITTPMFQNKIISILEE